MTIMGLLMIPLSIYLIYRVSLINSLLIGYFLSIFTTLSVFNIEKLGFSLTIGHFWMIILGAKVIYNLLIHKLTLKIRHNKYLYLFILFSFITIFFPMFIIRIYCYNYNHKHKCKQSHYKCRTFR